MQDSNFQKGLLDTAHKSKKLVKSFEGRKEKQSSHVFSQIVLTHFEKKQVLNRWVWKLNSFFFLNQKMVIYLLCTYFYVFIFFRTSSETIYTGSSMITASVVTALMCLAIGFLAGFFTSRRCSRDDYKSCGHHYLEHHLSK